MLPWPTETQETPNQAVVVHTSTPSPLPFIQPFRLHIHTPYQIYFPQPPVHVTYVYW